MMTEAAKEKLNTKLVDTCRHMQKSEVRVRFNGRTYELGDEIK